MELDSGLQNINVILLIVSLTDTGTEIFTAKEQSHYVKRNHLAAKRHFTRLRWLNYKSLMKICHSSFKFFDINSRNGSLQKKIGIDSIKDYSVYMNKRLSHTKITKKNTIKIA